MGEPQTESGRQNSLKLKKKIQDRAGMTILELVFQLYVESIKIATERARE